MMLKLLDTYTAARLRSLLENGHSIPTRIYDLLKRPMRRQRTNDVISVLEYAYRQKTKKTLERVLPPWMYEFVSFKMNNREQKHAFVEEYGQMLSLTHTIQNFKDKNDDALFRNYLSRWKSEQLDYMHRTRHVDLNLTLESDINKILQLKLYQSNNSPSSKILNLVKVRQQYNFVVKNKARPPDFKIIVDPNCFGEPPVPERIFNMRLRRLIKFQEYYKKLPPVTLQDISYLNGIDIAALDGMVREGYVEFLSTVFAIDGDANITRTNILEKRIAISEKIATMYM